MTNILQFKPEIIDLINVQNDVRKTNTIYNNKQELVNNRLLFWDRHIIKPNVQRVSKAKVSSKNLINRLFP